MISVIRRTSALLATAAIVSVLSPAASPAQSTLGPRWLPWFGCWSTGDTAPTVCVAPTADAHAVDIATIVDNRLVARDRINANGNASAINTKDCVGTRAVRFSSDARRVFMTSTTTCDGVPTSTSGLLAITPSGDWLDVTNDVAYGESTVRIAKYRESHVPSALPPDMAAALEGRMQVAHGARSVSGAPFGTAAVVEASRLADSSVVSAWLLELGRRFSLTASDLITMADAGVPGAVTDAMIAVSNPDAFPTSRSGDAVIDDEPSPRQHIVVLEPYSDGYRDRYPRYGSYYGYGYPGYYGRSYGGSSWGYTRPIIVVVPGNVSSTPAQMVKGRGYTQGKPSSAPDRNASERARGDTPTSQSSGTAESSGGRSASPAQPQAQPAEQRTAHPKP